MARVLVWDLPTRLFHTLLAVGFLAAAFISLALDEDGALFPYHAILGLVIAMMVVLRVVWGLVGTRYARFGSFTFGPGTVLKYLTGVAKGRGERHVGHNPGSAYAIFAMLIVVLALAATGIMLGTGSEGIKDLHEILAYAMLAVVGAHVLGVVVHSLRHRENLAASIVHGRKEALPDAGITSAAPLAGVVFLVIGGAWSARLLANYDAATNTTRLPVFGLSLQLGEAEGEGAERGEGGHGVRERDGEEDDD